MASPGAIVDGLAWAFPVLDELARKLRPEIASFDIDLEITHQTAAWNNSLNPHTTSPPAQTEKTLKGRKKDGANEFELLVVDRDAFALELAREWVRSGLPRSPVR